MWPQPWAPPETRLWCISPTHWGLIIPFRVPLLFNGVSNVILLRSLRTNRSKNWVLKTRSACQEKEVEASFHATNAHRAAHEVELHANRSKCKCSIILLLFPGSALLCVASFTWKAIRGGSLFRISWQAAQKWYVASWTPALTYESLQNHTTCITCSLPFFGWNLPFPFGSYREWTDWRWDLGSQESQFSLSAIPLGPFTMHLVQRY